MKRELQYEVTEEEDGLRLDQYIAGRCMDLSRSYIQKLIKESRVTINKNIQTKTKTAVQESDIVNVSLPDPKELEIKPQDIPLDILYEDNDVLVVNKPKGMVVHPAPGHYEDTLVNAVLYHCRDNLSGINGVLRPGIVHRIDKDTTGALIVCKNDKAHQKIADQLITFGISTNAISSGVGSGVETAFAVGTAVSTVFSATFTGIDFSSSADELWF